jgi:sulfur carrier protein ThiS
MSVRVVAFGGTQAIEVSDGATVELVCNQAGVSPEAHVAVDGEPVSPEDRASTPVSDEQTVTATPPKAGQGR